jgi:hypothetical protein
MLCAAENKIPEHQDAKREGCPFAFFLMRRSTRFLPWIDHFPVHGLKAQGYAPLHINPAFPFLLTPRRGIDRFMDQEKESRVSMI